MSKENTVLKGSMVGIDIGNDTVKIAEVKADGKALQITGLSGSEAHVCGLGPKLVVRVSNS